VPVRVQTIRFTPALTAQKYSAVVAARTLADLGFRVGGKVIARPVDIGDHVVAGQVLAVLDPTDLALSVQAAQAAVVAAEANATNAQADYDRYLRLGAKSPAFVPEEFDRRRALRDQTAAQRAQAEQTLAMARNQQAYGTLRADAPGVITALPVEVGQVVAAGQTVATLAHDGATDVVVDVPENRLGDVRAASRVSVVLWSAPGTVLHGHVREIGALADPASRSFVVKVALDDSAPELVRLGMTADVAFIRPASPRAILPASAIVEAGDRPAVWVLGADGHAIRRVVSIAAYNDDATVSIASGLTDGERVITAGAALVDPSMSLVAWGGPTR
jgi:membrane fusion protein, multidrug efflux system